MESTKVGIDSDIPGSSDRGSLSASRFEKRLSEQEENRTRLETTLALSDLGSRMTHKLKNPLAALMLSATRLKRSLKEAGVGDQELAVAGEIAGAITEFSKSLDRVFQKLPPVPVSFSTFSLGEALAFCLERVREEKDKPIEIVPRIPDDLPPLTGDPLLVRHALSNLLGLIVDGLPEGGTLRAELENEGGEGIRVRLKAPASGETLEGYDRVRWGTAAHVFKLHGGSLERSEPPEDALEASGFIPFRPAGKRARHTSNRTP